MNFKVDLLEAVRLGAASKRGALALSADDIQRVAQYAATCHAMLEDIQRAAKNAEAHGIAITPETLIAYLDNSLNAETSHGQANQQTQDQGHQPAGAADAGAGS